MDKKERESIIASLEYDIEEAKKVIAEKDDVIAEQRNV